jgi:hypothetical protein
MVLFTDKDKLLIHRGVDLLISRLEGEYEEIDCPCELDIELRLYDNKENCIMEETNISAPMDDGDSWDADWE